MEMTELIKHPERMNRDTLYELRSTLALHPYYQPARLLMLQNLYLLHDISFNEELRRAAVYITDRKTIFQMIEAAHYQLHQQELQEQPVPKDENRTVELIDFFLDSIPVEETGEKEHRQPTPADAAVDYVSYLLETSGDDSALKTPDMRGQDLIDNFLEQERGRILLNELPQSDPVENRRDDQNQADVNTGDEEIEEEYFTETLARIYIKQGRYQKALDIIGRLNEQFPHKNAYFADQIRFLEKLIINNSNNNKK
jgi:hypothetical protein